MASQNQAAEERIRIELIRALFSISAPSIIMSFGFMASALLICAWAREPLLTAAGIAASLIGLCRLALLLAIAPQFRSPEIGFARAQRLERLYGASYLAFAFALGSFGALGLILAPVESHLLIICLIVGYAAGVAAVAGLRLKIAVPSMLGATIPVIVTAPLRNDIFHIATALMMLGLLAGGVRAIRLRHRYKISEIGQRLSFGELARSDDLTGLPNRLALREWFEAVAAERRGKAVAIHYLDLDGFKPINDQCGHPTGDELLRRLALRLLENIRPGDFVARLGGDEFVVLQSRLQHPEEAEIFARRIQRAIGEPFALNRRELRVSASIGYAISAEKRDELETLLGQADEALYVAKRGAVKIVSYEHCRQARNRGFAA